VNRSDNSAGRLLNILEEAKKLNQPGQCIQAWARVLDIPVEHNGTILPDKEVELVHRLIEVHKLVDEVETALKKIEGIKHELYLKPFSRIREVISFTRFNHNFPDTINKLTESDLTILEFCSEKLSERHIERVVDEEQLKEIQAEINDLLEQVQASTLSDEIKVFILDQLEIIRRAIYEYRIRGIQCLREALQTNLGAVILNRELINTERDRKEVKRFGKIISALASVVTFAADTTTLLEAVGKYLPHLLSSGK
jgi:hypothetical protein